jgi:transcription termination factor NusB
MKRYIYALLFITSFALHSQSIVVLDSLNNSPLSFATITTKNQFFYADVNGEFPRSKIKLNDTITITYLGYKPNTTIYKGNDTLLLTPHVEQLNEVVISYSKKKKIKIGSLKKNMHFQSFPLKPKEELITVLEPKKEASKYFGKTIKSISLRFDKYDKKMQKYIKKKINRFHYISHKTKAAIRLNIYNIDSLGNFIKFYQSKPKYITTGNDTIIKFNISKKIFLNKNKIAYGLEMLGHVNSNGKIIIKKDIIRPVFNKKKNPYFSKKTFWVRKHPKKMIFISNLPHRVGKNHTSDLAITLELE